MNSEESGFPPKIQKFATDPDGEFLSLVSLLDDPDVRIATAVEDRLRARGSSMLHPLLEFIDLSGDELAKQRATTIALEFNESVLIEEFANLRFKLEEKKRGALEEGVFLIARYGYPRLDQEYYKAELDALAGMMHDRIKGILSPDEVLAAVNEFFFKTRGFKGNHEHFLEADNSYINQVLDRRIGIPISLAVIYVLVAGHRLGLPFTGVSTPGHFLIRYDGIPGEPLFIDAYNDGIILREKDIKKFLYTSGLPYYESFIRPASSRMILLRMIRNLIVLFEGKKDVVAQRAFERFQSALLGKRHEEAAEAPEDIFE
ncbi:MAG: transglutaminase-like domain-containing protein [Bacteroidota bacterium]|nr:transglutaminase-like domain-containing protein [Bacteroidota bacterium]MDP4229615.1 transglutaminase-like domain-containing protein [Bacteroidota bacterium]MDP4235850.1 transglutaminase-like domain-containing protein [Bacteroidota bacterium]